MFISISNERTLGLRENRVKMAIGKLDATGVQTRLNGRQRILHLPHEIQDGVAEGEQSSVFQQLQPWGAEAGPTTSPQVLCLAVVLETKRGSRFHNVIVERY